jgi:hypothetical protein
MSLKKAPAVSLHVGKLHAAHIQLMHSKPQPSWSFVTAALYLFAATPSGWLHSDYHFDIHGSMHHNTILIR